MWVFDEKVETAGISSKEDESWRDFYFRVIEEKNLLNYNDQEKAFIKRMEARETELKKQNFEVPEGLRVNMTNLLNPSQIKEFDQQLSQQLSEDGFAIVPALNAQLFQVYEQNDYNEFQLRDYRPLPAALSSLYRLHAEGVGNVSTLPDDGGLQLRDASRDEKDLPAD